MAPAISGYQYSHPIQGEEVCITGIAGYFPKSNSVLEFQDNLFNKVDLISDVSKLWGVRDINTQAKVGKINDVNKFDAGFFGMDFDMAHHMDPMSQLLLERTYEAIIDAGYNPMELRNTRTGVFISTCFVESDMALTADRMEINQHGIHGCSRSTLAVAIANWLGVCGPTYTLDTACSSSLFVTDHAFKAILDGRCDAAIVAGANLNNHFVIHQHFTRLGLTSPDGKCKSFDESADGYVRSESIVVCFLQRAKDSRRIHAQIVHVKTNCDGFKQKNILYPSSQMQAQLLRDFYEECAVSPDHLEYLESHCTGTVAGDPEECMAIDKVLCSQRTKPLLVGSVKSNMGHSEPMAGLCGIVKTCIAYNTGYIPPNINLSKQRRAISALMEGRIKVVTDKKLWNRGLAAVSSFGFGGANSHCLLKNITKSKINNGLPLDKLPRVVCVSGRTWSAVAIILQDLQSRPLDAEEIRLWHAIHERNIQGHEFRGYAVLHTEYNRRVSKAQEIKKKSGIQREICFLYSSLEKNIIGKFKQFMRIPVFANSIQRCNKILSCKDLDLLKAFEEFNQAQDENNMIILLVVAMQIALTDILKKISIKPTYIIGEGLGELCCAYADDCLTDEQTILAAYSLAMMYTERSYSRNSVCNENTEKIMETEGDILNCNARDFPDLELGHNVRNLLVQHELHKRNSKRWLSSIHQANCLDKLQTTDYVPYKILEVCKSETIVIGFCPKSHAMNNNSGNDCIFLPICSENGNYLTHFFQLFGTLYTLGLNPDLAQLYPMVEFPVSQGTPLLSHLVEWDHREHWYLSSKRLKKTMHSIERRVKISLEDEANEYLKGHYVNGQILYPATGYLVLVWETLALSRSTTCDFLPVEFEEVRWERATVIPEKTTVEFIITLHKNTGAFEIVENDVTVVTGCILAKEDIEKSVDDSPNMPENHNVDMKMTSKDFYKEMSLRGYGHRDLFQGILDCNIDGCHGRVIWSNNWVTYIDNMFQIYMLSKSSRELYVPTRLDKLAIDLNLHYANIILEDSKAYINIFQDTTANIIRSAGVEVRGIHFVPIAKSITCNEPTIEKYAFVPYVNQNCELYKFEDVLRIYFQIILENNPTSVLKVIEVFDKNKCAKPIIQEVNDLFHEIPGTDFHLKIVCDVDVQVPEHVKVETSIKSTDNNIMLMIGSDLLLNVNELQNFQSHLTKGGFLISREKQWPEIKELFLFDMIAKHNVGTECLILLRHQHLETCAKHVKIDTADETFSWVNNLKLSMKDSKVIAYAENQYTNGLIGLMNSLRKDVDNGMVSAFMITDPGAPPFDPTLKFYRAQIDKGLAINVFQDGKWGSYRFLPLKGLGSVRPTAHAFNNVEIIGNLSSLRWFEGPLTDEISDANIIDVYCAALNFRDVMLATGRVHIDSVVNDELKKDCGLGLEAVGRTVNGSRVISFVNKGFSNKVIHEADFLLPIPDEWSFTEAATVIVAYSTVYVGLIIIGKMRAGESVLIHAGAGGVGQAAINVALHHGCEVFTTVGTQEKRDIVKKLFPQLQDTHIGCSRDTSFHQMINRETKGRGVNIVLNSLSEDKLVASVRCLGHRGRYLEIGKYDIFKNTPVDMTYHEREISYHSVMLDYLDKYPRHIRQKLFELMVCGIASGAVRPLTFCTFDKSHIEPAYRYMAGGKHVGKIVIKLRDDMAELGPSSLHMNAIPRYTCGNNNVIILVGGLGGIGLELAHWLVMRGARKLLLVSTRGITNGYQKYRMGTWRSFNVNIEISTHDISSEAGCEEILKQANSMGPVEAIFNLAVVLRDAQFYDQTEETFKLAFKPKATITMNLDKLSRKLCPKLKFFVMFSSMTSGRGIAGQSNYGFGNSVMERICEKRKREGLPALAIQWGPVGDVGIVAEMMKQNAKMYIAGYAIQSIGSCLQTLEQCMMQDNVIVSSVMKTEKMVTNTNKLSVVETVAKIKGIRDLKAISYQATLIELGMDSMMAVEIKQSLERDFNIFLTTEEIRQLTFARLSELSSQVESTITKNEQSKVQRNILSVVLKNIGDEEKCKEPFIFMPSLVSDRKYNDHDSTDILFMIPGIEGCAAVFDNLCRKLCIRSCALQLCFYNYQQTLTELVDSLFEVVTKHLGRKTEFKLLGYSYGTIVAFALAEKLEKNGWIGRTIFTLDGSPHFFQKLTLSSYSASEHRENRRKEHMCFEDFILKNMLQTLGLPNNSKNLYRECNNFEDKINKILNNNVSVVTDTLQTYSKEFVKSLMMSVYQRYNIIDKFKINNKDKIKSSVVLIRTKENIIPSVSHDYDWDKYVNGKITVHCIMTDHTNLPDNTECAEILNRYLSE